MSLNFKKYALCTHSVVRGSVENSMELSSLKIINYPILVMAIGIWKFFCYTLDSMSQTCANFDFL